MSEKRLTSGSQITQILPQTCSSALPGIPYPRLLTTRLWRPAGSSRSFPGQGLVAGALSWRSLAWPVQELPHLPEARPSRGDWGGWDTAWSRS